MNQNEEEESEVEGAAVGKEKRKVERGGKMRRADRG